MAGPAGSRKFALVRARMFQSGRIRACAPAQPDTAE